MPTYINCSLNLVFTKYYNGDVACTESFQCETVYSEKATQLYLYSITFSPNLETSNVMLINKEFSTIGMEWNRMRTL